MQGCVSAKQRPSESQVPLFYTCLHNLLMPPAACQVWSYLLTNLIFMQSNSAVLLYSAEELFFLHLHALSQWHAGKAYCLILNCILARTWVKIPQGISLPQNSLCCFHALILCWHGAQECLCRSRERVQELALRLLRLWDSCAWPDQTADRWHQRSMKAVRSPQVSVIRGILWGS